MAGIHLLRDFMHICEPLSGVRPGYRIHILIGSDNDDFDDFGQSYSGLTEDDARYLVAALTEINKHSRVLFMRWYEENPRPESMNRGEGKGPYENDTEFTYRLFALQPSWFIYSGIISVFYFEDAPEDIVREFLP